MICMEEENRISWAGSRFLRKGNGEQMKKNIQGIILTAALLLTCIVPSFAIEGLQVSVQCTNAILTWPCLDDGSEQFVVQYRPTLDVTDQWQTLETDLPATFGTNLMCYTNYGA